jgi:hypothetical protein
MAAGNHICTLMTTASKGFQRLPDHRRDNASYDLAGVSRRAFAISSLRSPSRLSFREQIKNGARIYFLVFAFRPKVFSTGYFQKAYSVIHVA